MEFDKWWLVGGLFLIGFLLLISGAVGVFAESFQVVIKKVFLLCLWYGFVYLVRVMRIGRIAWDELGDEFKVYYYFILLLGSAMIVAWG